MVDDQPKILEMAVELIRIMGYDVLSANYGATALDILNREPDIEVLLIDGLMPGMTGIALGMAEIVKKLRRAA